MNAKPCMKTEITRGSVVRVDSVRGGMIGRLVV